MITRALLCLASGVLATKGSGQDMIAVDIYGDVYTIDSATGQTFLVDPDTNRSVTNSMAKDSQGRIFVATEFEITILDPYRAMFSSVVQMPFNGVTGMAFGAGDVLYVLNSEAFDIDVLYTIDLATGSATRIGSTRSKILQSLAYWNGLLYSYENADLASAARGLVTVDPTSGVLTDVNPAISSGVGDVQTLCFDSAGTLQAASTVLATIDLTTGKPSVYANLGLWARGMEFLPTNPYPLRLSVPGECHGFMEAGVSGASPRDVIAFLYSVNSSGPFTIPSGPCAGTVVELGTNTMFGVFSNAGQFGNARSPVFPGPAAACGLVRMQALNLTTCETSNVVLVQ